MGALDKLREMKEKIDEFQERRQKKRMERMKADTARMKTEQGYYEAQRKMNRVKAEAAAYKSAEQKARGNIFGEMMNFGVDGFGSTKSKSRSDSGMFGMPNFDSFGSRPERHEKKKSKKRGQTIVIHVRK